MVYYPPQNGLPPEIPIHGDLASADGRALTQAERDAVWAMIKLLALSGDIEASIYLEHLLNAGLIRVDENLTNAYAESRHGILYLSADLMSPPMNFIDNIWLASILLHESYHLRFDMLQGGTNIIREFFYRDMSLYEIRAWNAQKKWLQQELLRTDLTDQQRADIQEKIDECDKNIKEYTDKKNSISGQGFLFAQVEIDAFAASGIFLTASDNRLLSTPIQGNRR